MMRSMRLGLRDNALRDWVCVQISFALLCGAWCAPVASAAEAVDPALRAYVQDAQHRQAYGVYVKDRKLGWAVDEMKLGQLDGQEVAVQTFELHWRYNSGRETSSCDTKTIDYFVLQGEGAIIRGEEDVNEDGTQTHRSIRREGDQVVITSHSKGAETTRRVPLPKETLAHMQSLDNWLRKGPARGARFTDYSTDWGEDDVNQPDLITIRGRKTILWGGVKTLVYLVSISSSGAMTDGEITTDGTMIKGYTSGLFEMRAEKESVAKQTTSDMVDLLQASSISVDRDLGEPEKVDALTLEITGMEHLDLPSSRRQRVRWHRGNTTVVELVKDAPARRPERLSADDRTRYLAATASIQCNEKPIKDLTKEIVGDSKDTMEQVGLLERWVFGHVRQTMAANASTALDVLQNRAGDCTELTLLFVTLARAAGIPAREVNGVMFVGDGQALFGWHAWAEIHDGRQWVTVDPTWDEIYVDATHLKVSDDEDDWRWVNALGRLKFHVIKFHSNSAHETQKARQSHSGDAFPLIPTSFGEKGNHLAPTSKE